MNDYLVISRGVWDEQASRDDLQAAIDAFYAWYECGLAEGRMKQGSRLQNAGKVVSRAGVQDGPYAETKEVVGGYWFIVAESLEAAASIAAENPCLRFGLELEIRPLEAVRASAVEVTNETPPAWRAGGG